MTHDELARKAVADLVTASAHLSMYEVAKRADLPQSTVSRIWSGRQLPSLATFIRLCAAVGHKPDLMLPAL